MARIGTFKNAGTRERYVALYDAVAARWPVPSEELDVPTSFGSTRVRRWGLASGSPIVLVHQHLGTSLAWSGFAEALGRHHLVLAVDTIGTAGRSVQERAVEGPGDLSTWMAEVLDGLGVDEPVHLVGYSQGGFVALHVAAGGAVRLASLVAIEPGALVRFRWRFIATLVGVGVLAARSRRRSGSGGGALRAFAQQLAPGIELSDEEWNLTTVAAMGFRQGLPLPRRLPGERLRSIVAPTLLYLGGRTELYDPDKAAARARALLTHVEVEIVPGVGHGLPLLFPERTTRAILDFVERHDTAGDVTFDGAHRDD